MDKTILEKMGFSDKQITVYLALLQNGPSSVRKLAENTGINRGTVHEILKFFQDQGLASYYHKDKNQYFAAEDPLKLKQIVKSKTDDLKQVEFKLESLVPELQALYQQEGEKPVAKYFDKKGLKHILEDLLETCAKSEDKKYRVYSAAQIREFLYEDFPSFSDARIAKGISVKVIAMGKGGQLRGLDERKWLEAEYKKPTYILIYPGKTAYIALNNLGEPVGVLIDNQGIYETQKILFDSLWNRL